MSERCDGCYKRPGSVFIDEMVGPFPLAGVDAFRFTYRLCRWCRGVWTRRAKRRTASRPSQGRDREEG